MRKLLILAFVLLVGLMAVSAQDVPTVTVAPDGSVVIGVAAAISGEGLAPLGEDIVRGAELAVDDHPVVTVGGKEFAVKLDVQDDQCSAEGGQAIANRYASDASVVGVVGPMCSSACRAAAPIFDGGLYSSISPSCTAPDLSASGFISFNRAVVSDAFQGKVMGEYIYSLGITKIATLHDGSAYGEGLVKVVTDVFIALGGEVVAADAVNVGDTDFRGLLEDIAAAGPELIYFGGFPAEAARLAQQRADVGLEDVPFMGADGIKTDEFLNLAGDAAEGVYASSSIPSAGNQEAVDALLARYQEKYGTEPTGPFQVNAYDATNMILAAVEAVGTLDADGNLVIDRAALAAYLRTLTGFEGLTGTMNCDGTGECVVSDIGIVQVTDGAFADVATGHPNEDGTITLTAAG